MLLYFLNKLLIQQYGVILTTSMYAYFAFVIFLYNSPEHADRFNRKVRELITPQYYDQIEIRYNRVVVTFYQIKQFIDKKIEEHTLLMLKEAETMKNLEKKDEEKPAAPKQPEKYEDKYLEKYKAFVNEYQLTKEEQELQITIENEFKATFNKNIKDDLDEVKTEISKIDGLLYENNLDLIAQYAGFDNYEHGKQIFFDDSDDLEDNAVKNEVIKVKEQTRNDKFISNIKEEIQAERNKYSIILLDLETKTISNEEMAELAYQKVLNKKLDKLINSYIVENTPLGNVFMRYNNDKKSFEYYSNSSIPYRYLEVIGRKYVMTYFCKPLYVDLTNELNKSKLKKMEQDANNKLEEKQKIDALKKTSKQIFANLKSYNKDARPQQHQSQSRPMKNRQPAPMVMPPQIKPITQNSDNNSDAHLLKENANRYTWEGRLHDVQLLKKIPKELVDKNYKLTFAEYKKMQLSKT